MARRQYTVVFTCDSSKLGDALAELKGIGVENLGFDLLQSRMVPPHLTEPGAKPTRSAVVMQPRALPSPKQRAPYGQGSKARVLSNGKNASQSVVDYVKSKKEGATSREIRDYLVKLGFDSPKGVSTIAPGLTYQGRLTVDRSGPVGIYHYNPKWKPSRFGGKKPAHSRPDLYVNGQYANPETTKSDVNNDVTGE